MEMKKVTSRLFSSIKNKYKNISVFSDADVKLKKVANSAKKCNNF